MCGFAGFITLKKFDELKKASDTISHRGPDANGYFSDKNVHFFHHRLKIIDLEGSVQPFKDEDNRYSLIYNGEIYNFRELRKDLEEKGHKFRTSGDTEVVLKAFQEFKEDSFKLLNGIFAFAIYDKKEQKIIVVRDPFGVKPLYFAHHKDGDFSFASEMKAILAAYPELKKDINYDALNYLLTFKFLPEKETLLKGISKLEPGHYLTFDLTRTQRSEVRRKGHERKRVPFSIKRYSDFIENYAPTKSTNKEEFYRNFREAVERQLISDVPVGVYLSGGIDSSVIASTMRDISPDQELLTFSVVFPGEKVDESIYSSLVAEQLNTFHTKLALKSCDFEKYFKKVILHLEEPFSDPAALPIYMLSEEAKKKVTVVLTGEGSDELLLGYKKYKLFVILNWLRKPAFKPFVRLLLKFLPKKSLHRILIEEDFKAKDDIDRVLNTHKVFTAEVKNRLLTTKVRGEMTKSMREYMGPYFKQNRDFLTNLQYFDMKTWLVNDPLIKLDRMLMAHGLEGRVPFLDLKFSKYALNLRNKYKLSPIAFKEKSILTKAFKGKIPKEILKRKKHTFDIPIHIFKKEIEGILNEKSMKKRGIFNYDEVVNLLEQNWHSSGVVTRIWLLACIELWFKIFIDSNKKL